MRNWEVFIPGYGVVIVRATSRNGANIAAGQAAWNLGIPQINPPGSLNDTIEVRDTVTDSDISKYSGAFLINNVGGVVAPITPGQNGFAGILSQYTSGALDNIANQVEEQTGGEGTGLAPGQQGPVTVTQPGGPVDPPADASLPGYDPTVGQDPEAVSTFGAFRNFLNQKGLNPDSVLGGAAQSQYSPLLSTFALKQVLQNTGAEYREGEGEGSVADQLNALGGPQSFMNFLNYHGIRGRNTSNIARNSLLGVANTPGSGSDNSFLSWLQGATPGSDAGRILQDVSRQALGTILSPAAQGLFGEGAINMAGRKYNDKLAATAPTGENISFADFLSQTLGLR